MSYGGFTIERRRHLWIARRRSRAAIYQLAPARSLREIQARIDEFNTSRAWEELVAA